MSSLASAGLRSPSEVWESQKRASLGTVPGVKPPGWLHPGNSTSHNQAFLGHRVLSASSPTCSPAAPPWVCSRPVHTPQPSSVRRVQPAAPGLRSLPQLPVGRGGRTGPCSVARALSLCSLSPPPRNGLVPGLHGREPMQCHGRAGVGHRPRDQEDASNLVQPLYVRVCPM